MSRATPKLRAIVAVAVVLLVCLAVSGLAGPADGAEPKGRGQGKASGETEGSGEGGKRQGGGKPSLPFIEINAEQGYVDVEGQVCLRKGPLELVVTIRGGKEHESVFVLDARPRHLHFALLALGLEPGRPGRWRYKNKEPVPINPTGDPVRITVRYKNAEGERVEHPISYFVRDKGSGKSMGQTNFLFAGSRIKKTRGDEKPSYLADSSGDVVSLVSFNDEVLALPEAASNANEKLVWEAHTPRIPEVGHDVVLRFRPAKAAGGGKGVEPGRANGSDGSSGSGGDSTGAGG